eukprot:729796_1
MALNCNKRFRLCTIILLILYLFGLSVQLLDFSQSSVMLTNFLYVILENRFAEVHIFEDQSHSPPFPIDVVYTFAGEIRNNGQRQRYNGDLRYSLRSIYTYIPWVNAIYIVVSDNTSYPSWIVKHKATPQNCSIPLYLVRHSDIYTNISNSVDNHNSYSIESRIHHISNLSNHFIYFNDDFFMFRATSYLFFFDDEGTPRFPAASIFPHYNKKRRRYSTLHPVYANQKRLNITFKIPFTFHKTYGQLGEHMAGHTPERVYLNWKERTLSGSNWWKLIRNDSVHRGLRLDAMRTVCI